MTDQDLSPSGDHDLNAIDGAGRQIKPGATVLRMGADIPVLGIYFGETYEVESYNPKAIDGLKIKGVQISLNADNFEVLYQPPVQQTV